MNKKEIKRRRMWTYFIDATEELIKTEGFQQVTIRNVAEKAGYNSATLYNYFGEFSHLLFFASFKFLRPYLEKVTKEMKKEEDPIQKYIVAWECYSEYSFNNPEIFNAVFLMDLGDHPENLLDRYYELYPSDLLEIPEELHPLLFDRNISSRGRFALSGIVAAGILSEEKAEELNELTNLVWQGMFSNLLNNRAFYSPEEAHERTMKYVKKIIKSIVEEK
ncbi:TetR/AcrR family transcriptional regulator [Psychrobacillus vulpis]|uniref:TetR/AcrR family transcriptional regulator n=1 Tax=Psychrobacillus vulpis TaxID=2325572 RepID=A0A544TVZ6_9BACI|nr:TetR/AcrR family transcriptional regulator [Psychrobacillus vulpis]TQR21623.1 TetR/AcrR family transcriptional regulator [Psychrobacillus vulpis]